MILKPFKAYIQKLVDEQTRLMWNAYGRESEERRVELNLEFQKLEAFYETCREARALAIKALGRVESLDETKAYLWRVSQPEAPAAPLPKKEPVPDYLGALDKIRANNDLLDDDF